MRRFAGVSIRLRAALALLFPILIMSGVAPVAGANGVTDKPVEINIPAGSLVKALEKLGDQSGVQVMYETGLADGVTVRALNGKFTVREALTQLLANTGIKMESRDEKMVVLKRITPVTSAGSPADQMRVAMVEKDEEVRGKTSGEEKDPQQVVVQDRRIKPLSDINVDLPRTIDDAQPYYIFDAETIRQSGSLNVGEFLMRRLTMNTVSWDSMQKSAGATLGGNVSSVTLRGLSEQETLILVNGRRLPSRNISLNSSTPTAQPDLNGIPLSAIDRIEVLPSSASGIYGANAVGGVVNVILKRDYAGSEIQLDYLNTFDTDAPVGSVSVSGGLSLERGRTQLNFSASATDSRSLRVADRLEVWRRGFDAVLKNNPSSLYGPGRPYAYGSTPNIASANGSNLVLRDGTPLNSPFTFVPEGYEGPAGDGGAALLANAGRQNMELPATNQSLVGLDYVMGSSPQTHSFMGSARRAMTGWLEAYADLMYSTNTQSEILNPFSISTFTLRAPVAGSPLYGPANPFQQEIRIAVPQSTYAAYDVEQAFRRATGGLVVKLPANWQLALDYSWSASRGRTQSVRTNSADLDFGAGLGQIDLVRDTVAHPVDFSGYLIPDEQAQNSELAETALRASGALWSMPGGEAALRAHLSRREEKSPATEYFNPDPYSQTRQFVPAKKQETDSAYLELNLPFVTRVNGRTGLRRLELQLAARGEKFDTTTSDHSILSYPGMPQPQEPSFSRSAYSSVNPTLGLRYSPFEHLMVRTSYATAFRAPRYDELFPRAATPFFLIDPRRGGEINFTALVHSGGNPDLKPEDSTTYTAGLVFSPGFARQDLRLSVDYLRIEKRNAITTLNPFQMLNDESLYPGRVTRVDAAPGDPFGVGRVTFVDARITNLHRMDVESYDSALNYGLETAAHGRFEFHATATWLMHVRTYVAPGAPPSEQVGSAGGTLKFKANGGVAWRREGWTAGWLIRFTPSFAVHSSVVAAQGADHIPSQTYHDLFVSYEIPRAAAGTPGGHKLLDGCLFQLGIRNVFDKVPPFDASNTTYYYSTYGDIRLRQYSLSLRKQF